MSKTCIIVLNWNRPDHTLECLNSLLPLLERNECALVVCDNGSTDDSIYCFESWAVRNLQVDGKNGFQYDIDDPGLDWDFALIETGSNLGYAAGNNVGIRFVAKSDRFDFAWILNNDTSVEAKALSHLLSHASLHPDAAILGSTILDYYSHNTVQYAGGAYFYPLLTIFRPSLRGKKADQLPLVDGAKLDYICGASMFIRLDALQEIGLLDERFFLYYEEIDLARRLRKNGWKLLWCKDSVIYHKGAVSTGGRTLKNPADSSLANYHENLSTLRFTAKHHPFLFPFAAIFRFFSKGIISLSRGRPDLARLLCRCYLDFFTSKPAVEQSFSSPQLRLLAKNPGVPKIGFC